MREYGFSAKFSDFFRKPSYSLFRLVSEALEFQTNLQRNTGTGNTGSGLTAQGVRIFTCHFLYKLLKNLIIDWTFDRMSNASTEGFNNKIRWLIRQAYGFRGVFYLKLKIFQLASIQPQKELWFMVQNGEVTKNGGKDRDRTGDTRIFSPLLYQLS